VQFVSNDTPVHVQQGDLRCVDWTAADVVLINSTW